MRTFKQLLAAASIAACVGAPLTASAADSAGLGAHWNFPLLGNWCTHTEDEHFVAPSWWPTYDWHWECISWGSSGQGGCSSNDWWAASGNTWDQNREVSCFWNQGSNLWYGWSGVCHQAANQGLYATDVPWVRYWGSIGCRGLSYNLFCDLGNNDSCMGPNC